MYSMGEVGKNNKKKIFRKYEKQNEKKIQLTNSLRIS